MRQRGGSIKTAMSKRMSTFTDALTLRMLSGRVTISRAAGTMTFPSQFQRQRPRGTNPPDVRRERGRKR